MSQKLLKKWKSIIGSDKPKKDPDDFNLLSPKKYHTASTIYRKAPRFDTERSSIEKPDFDHTPITAQEGKMLMYVEVLVP
jgi:hypothetical protein